MFQQRAISPCLLLKGGIPPFFGTRCALEDGFVMNRVGVLFCCGWLFGVIVLIGFGR